MKKTAVLILSFILLLLCAGCAHGSEKPTFGVWWWNSNLPSGQYLEFAESEGVTEIYYCNSEFGEQTKSFIKSALKRGISVYLLAGEYQWLDDPSSLYALIDGYKKYQSENADARFAGIHLDIEPHQSSDFSVRRKELLKSLISLADGLKKNYADITFDYDIPFWIDDEIDFGGKALPAYAHMIEIADRTFIMSYRDTAEAILDVAKDEIAFAESAGKTLVLGVETYSEEGDFVSFAEEGKAYMYGEIEKLKKSLPDKFGISIHQIKTWYDLKD